MADYKEVTENVEVPRNTGVEGFMLTIRKILSLPRIQSIHINANGKIKFVRIIREAEEVKPIEMDFSTVLPSGIVRNNELVELQDEWDAPKAIAKMFSRVASEHLFPVAWVSGPGSTFWLWHEKAGISTLSKEEAYGLPFLYDSNFPPSTLVLCTGYTRTSAMIDVKKSFKTLMPEAHQLMKKDPS